ncbi:hypothetical protein PILCRDRAFT_820618 [Piloderma croceum F 1598]|uniref:Major facilitator superfamily (MFS) profile domain-containing protein n=1 Tax=Piloderma croceum (strain F 1598) TaxID=765440 RepID=A0A0C3FRA6_PILCF|nr:hypothetical protein PILCRDRAFT_820618 [Piloderma croceum F 1598]
MNAIKSSLPEVYNLPSLSQNRPNSDTSQSASRLEREGTRQAIHPLTEEVAPENAATDQRPTRRYQIMLLLSGFFMTFHVIGINFIYGVFQDFYTSPQSNIKDAQGQDALVSLVGSIATGLTWSGSIFVNPMIARFQNVKLITLSGAFIMSLGLFLASYSTKIWHLYLTQSLLYGIGSSMYYFPIMALTPVYFDRHRGFAMGFVLAGSGIGGLVLAPLLRFLLDRVGVQWALKILAIWNFVIALPVSLVIRQKPGFGARAADRGTMINKALMTKGTFVSQSLGAFLQASGNVVPLYYMTTYSTSVLSWSSSTGSLILAMNNAVNSISRVLMGILADRVGRQNTMVASVILSGLSVLALWYEAPRARFIAFVVFYGILAGGYNALLPTTITEVYGTQHYARVNGFIYFIRGIGAIFGAPIAGVILGSHTRGAVVNMGLGALRKRYNDVVIYDAALLLAAGMCMAYVRWLDARDKGRWTWKA